MTNMEAEERILKATRVKDQVIFRGKPIIMTPEFSNQVMKARGTWSDVFQTLKEDNF